MEYKKIEQQSPNSASQGGWPLLRGRLRPPATRSVIVERPRISALLDQAASYEVTLVFAPAGFGKTTAVAQWFQHHAPEGCSRAWVSLDEMDSEPTRILMYLAASLSASSPELSAELSGLFDTGFEASVSATLSALFSAIEGHDKPVFMVVDDLHGSLEDEATSIFASLVNHGLANLHVILILRDAVDLPLARVRMRHAMLELGPLDLQFSEEEAEAYFAVQQDLAVDQDDVRALCERTDGWIAALQLAVLSLRGQGDTKEFIQRFSGTHRDVSDLLAEEVLARLSPDMVDFLERSAVLSSFSAELCDSIFGRDDSRQVIGRLETGNFFIFNMDDERVFYRYHRLFGEHLRRNLVERDAAAIPAINRAAAEWYRDHGLPVRACMHAAQSDDDNFLGEVLAAVASELRELGYGGTVMRYAAMLPSKVANRYPMMQLDRIYALTLSWRFDEARQVLDQVRSTLTRDEGAGDALYPELLHRESQLALLTDQHTDSERLCSEWLELGHERSSFDEAVVRTSLIWSRVERYDFSGLEQAADIRTAFDAPEMDWAKVWNDTIFGACFFSRGDIARAASMYRRGLEVAVTLGGRHSSTPAMPGLHLAELLYECGELEEAGSLVKDYLALVARMGLLGQLAAGYVTQAKLLRLSGDVDGALKVLDEGSAVAERRNFRRLHHILMSERYQILLEQGNIERCFRIARADGLVSSLDELTRPQAFSSLSEPQALAWAEIGLAKNRVTEASELLERWRKFLISRGALRSAIRFNILATRAAIIRGDKPKALRLLRESLTWANDCGFVRSVIDGGTPVIDLLQSAEISDEKLMPVRDRLLREAGIFPADTVEPAVASDSPVEPLNARETEILRLVEQGMMNKQIAANLGLTVGTVKWYMRQIFQKLDVRRRAQAIHRAKHLGFLK